MSDIAWDHFGNEDWNVGYRDGFYAATFGDRYEGGADHESEYTHGYDTGYEDGLASLAP